MASRLTVIYVLLHCATWRSMRRIGEGRALNAILGMTSRNMLCFTLLVVMALMIE